MLKNISWQEYLLVVGIATTVYYLFILIKYYPNELKRVIQGRRTSKPAMLQYEDAAESFDIIQPSGGEELVNNEIQEIEQLAGGIKEMITKNGKSGKELLLQSLGEQLSLHPKLKKSALRDSINELVVSECEKNGVADISVDEVERCW